MMEEEAGTSSGQAITDNLKKALNKLLQNEFDQFEVLGLAQKLALDIQNESDFSQQQYVLQKCVLEHIIKSDSSVYYMRLLEETTRMIHRKQDNKYSCCLVGCLFQSNKHRDYLQHLKKVHSTHKELVCNFMYSCSRQFSTMDLLIQHVKDSHSLVKPGNSQAAVGTISSVACKCNMLSCGGLHFPSTEKLMTHIINFHSKESRECVFENCFAKFPSGKVSTARHHFALKHKKVNKLVLKLKHTVSPLNEDHNEVETSLMTCDEPLDEDHEDDDANRYDFYTAEEINTIETIADEEDENDLNYYMMQYADFYNRLCHMKHIPHKTVQEISNEYLENSIKSKEIKEKKLRSSLRNVNMTESEIDKVVQEVITDDDFLKAQQALNTEFKRNKFIQTNFKYVPPIEIVLNKEEVLLGEAKDVVHYIPVTESFQHLMEDKTLNDVLEKKRKSTKNPSDVLTDFTDGEAFKKN